MTYYVITIFLSLTYLTYLSVLSAWGNLKPENIKSALTQKAHQYQTEGLIIGGDQAINATIIQNIRYARQNHYERVVFDLQGSHRGKPVAIERPPYYQVALIPEENRLHLTFWGDPQLQFQASQVIQSFQKSQLIQKILLFPKIEENLWSCTFELRKPIQIEVFELFHPLRLILDIQAKKK